MDHRVVSLCVSAQWLSSFVHGVSPITPGADPLTELYSGQISPTAVPMIVIEKLTNPILHCRVCSLISTTHTEVTNSNTFSSVLQWLGRQGIYLVGPRGSPLSDVSLEQQRPFHLESHQALLDALMEAYIRKRVTIEGVVRAVRQLGEFSASRDLPDNLEEALVLWINRVCKHCGGTAGSVSIGNLLLSLQDGRCLALLLSHYLPKARDQLNATVLSAHPPPPGALVQVRSVCNAWLPPPSFHLPPTALATHPFEPTWRWHLLVTLAHLFWCFEGEGCSLVNQHPSEPLTRAFTKPPSGTVGRKDTTSGATRTRGYSAGGLSSTSDTSLVTAHSESATNLTRAVFHPPLRKSGSVSQLPAQGNSNDRISASVTGLVRDAAQQKVASHLRVRRVSSTSSLGWEQQGTAGEIILDSGSTADSTMRGNVVSVVSETELVRCPQERLGMSKGNSLEPRREAWAIPLRSDLVFSSGKLTCNFNQLIRPTVQGGVPYNTGSQPVVSLLTGVDCIKSSENVTMTTEQANTSTVTATMTEVDVAMAADNVAMTTCVPSQQCISHPSPPPAGSVSDLQPIKEVGVIFLDEPKKTDWDYSLPKDPDSLLVRMKIQAFMHQYKERKEARRAQVAREWHAERMRQAARMCASGVVDTSLLFPPSQQVDPVEPRTREDASLGLNGTEVKCAAVVPSTGHEPYKYKGQHQCSIQPDGATMPPPCDTPPTPPAPPSPPATSPTPIASPPPPVASPPPPVGSPPPPIASPPPPIASPPPPIASPPHPVGSPPAPATTCPPATSFPPFDVSSPPPATSSPPPATSSPPPDTLPPPPAISFPPPATSSPPPATLSPPPDTLPPPPPNRTLSVDATELPNEEQKPEWKRRHDVMKARLEERERARREAAERKRAEREAKRQQNQSSILEHSRDTHHGPVPLPHQPLAVQHTPPQLQPKPAQPQPRPTQPQPGPAQPQPRPAQPQPGPAQPLPPSSNAVHSTVAVEPRLGQPARPVVSYAPPPQLPTGGEWHAAPAHLQTIRFILSDANRVEDVMPKPPATLYAHTGPKCYHPPKGKTNKQLMRVALSTVCLAGDANLDRRIEALQALDEAEASHILIHFKDGAGSRKFKGLYAFVPDTNEARKVHGAGPRVVTPDKVAAFFKYNSGSREFFTVPAKYFSFSIDGFTIAPQYWSTRKGRK